MSTWSASPLNSTNSTKFRADGCMVFAQQASIASVKTGRRSLVTNT
jgi:hypothetical protein